jgi:hypothetical protein
MKRITISIDDRLFSSLIDYTIDRSKKSVIRLSISKATMELLSRALASGGKYGNPDPKKRLAGKDSTE